MNNENLEAKKDCNCKKIIKYHDKTYNYVGVPFYIAAIRRDRKNQIKLKFRVRIITPTPQRLILIFFLQTVIDILGQEISKKDR